MPKETQRQNLYEIIADKMERDILRHKSNGEKLPSEQKLASMYEVSRTVIREANKILNERGLINFKIGSGAYVTVPEAQSLSDVAYRIINMNNIDYGSVYDVRLILEVDAAKKAARFVTDEELKEMRSILEQLKDYSLPLDERSELDFRFHYMIANASRNPMLCMLIETMGNLLKNLISESSENDGALDDGIMRHQFIIEALSSRDVEMAGFYMMDHICASKRHYFTYQEKRMKTSEA